jgi:predicted TIM-barrel fold metal-dependent hydrolase
MIRLNDIPVVDDHAHVAMMEQREGSLITPLRGQLQAFAAADVQSSVSSDVWQQFEPAWSSGRLRKSRGETDPLLANLLRDAEMGRETTAYSIHLRQTCEDLYGTDAIGDDFEETSDLARSEGPANLWIKMLDLSGTRVILSDEPRLDPRRYPKSRFRWILRLDGLLYPFGRPDAYARGLQTAVLLDESRKTFQLMLSSQNVKEVPSNLSDYKLLISDIMENFAEDAVSFKIVSAYIRSLAFAKPSEREASTAYERLAKGGNEGHVIVEDYLAHYMLRKARDLSKPVQFHTGYGGVFPGLVVADANPLLLQAICADEELRGLKIVLLHGSYPFVGEAACLVCNFHNVYLDFSWIPLLFHGMLSKWLYEWLEFLPSTRVLFGSDVYSPEAQLASVRSAKKCLEDALTEGMSGGLWSRMDAEKIGSRLFHDNASKLYNVSNA